MHFQLLFLLFSFWVPIMWMLVHLMLSQRSQLLSFFHLIFFLLLVSIILYFRSLTHFLHHLVVVHSIVCSPVSVTEFFNSYFLGAFLEFLTPVKILTVLHVPHLKNKDNNSTYLIELLKGLNGLLFVKLLEQWLK